MAFLLAIICGPALKTNHKYALNIITIGYGDDINGKLSIRGTEHIFTLNFNTLYLFFNKHKPFPFQS